MKKFDYVEDYIEVITGYKDIATGKQSSTFYFGINPIVNLARYDVSVLESMADTVLRRGALTERQGDLACKIILKYQRQLANKLVDVSPVEKPKWRIPLRQMDYSQTLTLQNDKLALRFPFKNDMIETIRAFARESQGPVRWNKESKVWDIALTEYNLSWAVTWAQVNNVTVDPAVLHLMDLIKTTEQQTYAIELYVTDRGELDISNAEDSLKQYISDNLGGFSLDNLLKLVTASAELAYTVNADLAQAIIAEYGHRFYNLATNKEIKINPGTLLTTDDFESVIDYAITCNQWPVVVYEPDLSNRMLNRLQLRFSSPDLLIVNNQKNPVIPDTVKFIHTNKPLRNITSIPMIVSSAGMVFGGDKQIMLQRAKKVVYCAADVYNKNQVGRKVKDIGS